MRAVSVPFSPARPSRLKNEPGIFPAAYIRSSTSTVSGRKSASRRPPAVAVASTIVSPWRTTTAPPACFAIRPVSNEISLPAISTESRVTAFTAHVLPSCPPFGRRLLLVKSSESEHKDATGSGRRSRSGVGAPGRIVPPAISVGVSRDPGAHAGARLRPHERRDLAPRGGRARSARGRGRACARAPTGAGRRYAAGILEERVVELPEAALARRRLGGAGERHRPRVALGEREVAEGDPQRRVAQPLVRERAARAGVVAVEDDERRLRVARTWSPSPGGGAGALRRSLTAARLTTLHMSL